MMSHESHHLHHQHPFNEFSAMVGNSSAMNNFETGVGHDLFHMNMSSSNHNWRGFSQDSDATVSVAAASAWPLESDLHANQVQSLSLSLYNPPPQPPSFQLSSHHPFHIKSCKYLLPTQELINEFCSLGGGNSFKRNNFAKPMDDSSSSWSQQSLYSMEPIELQKRKAKLLSMLEEVDRRYKRYCEQMKAVVSSFEDIAGEGAARTYSQLASKAMSRHFRCLRDGINGQIKATRRAMGENEAAATATGLTRGETPRLKLLDQCLRQQKAFQQAGMMESHPWRPQRGLPDRSVSILRAWLFEHFLHPYPSDVDKHILARQTGLSRSQVSNWFINARVRLWKPMVEEMYMEELKEDDKNSQSSHATTMQEAGTSCNNPYSNPNPNPSPSSHLGAFEDRKPKTCHFQIDEQNSLSSIINNINTHHHNPNPNPNQNFGIIDTDFGSYHGHELTLSLQQHERPLLFTRELPIGDDGDEVQFSILEGESQNIPYRNLMGAQLLHDLAG
ncbi:homeobox protein BEL1 homolog [Dendrobium catenatum]|uniref:Homeobox protein BEL1 like n=1 Tax=Dendrobium catenatum TaxID=906689 RepID=A0A2I0X2D7_9ASPA|nr:homeobox protein BEL1 homolog [Dendrobium catenatum]PKU82062.1 Homeobox protein BEL1 like [Dendrobium catenatum]